MTSAGTMRDRTRTSARGDAGVLKDSLVHRGWVVVATHRGPHRAGGPHPWGTAHLKMIGAPHTACGELARGWRGFWHLDFRTDVESPCQECATAVWPELRGR